MPKSHLTDLRILYQSRDLEEPYSVFFISGRAFTCIIRQLKKDFDIMISVIFHENFHVISTIRIN